VLGNAGVIHAEDKIKWEDYAVAFTAVWKEVPASKRRPASAAEALKEVRTPCRSGQEVRATCCRQSGHDLCIFPLISTLGGCFTCFEEISL
jgi:hypothetical protein